MSSRNTNRYWHEGLITAVAFGGFLIILGSIFGLTPDMPQKTGAFFSDLVLNTFPFGSGTLALPAPANPTAHLDFFGAVFNFMVGIGILQVVILALRLWARSRIGRIAETVGNLVFWLGGAVMANVFLLSGTVNGWFQFWATLIILAGASLIAQFIVRLAKRQIQPKTG